jgi:hypothetical protein
MDNPEKLVTQGTEDKEKQNPICVGHKELVFLINIRIHLELVIIITWLYHK